MTTIDKLRTLTRELAGEAWNYDCRCLAAQAHVRREAAKAVMKQADSGNWCGSARTALPEECGSVPQPLPRRPNPSRRRR